MVNGFALALKNKSKNVVASPTPPLTDWVRLALHFVFILESVGRMQLRGINSPLFINSIQVKALAFVSTLVLSLR